MKIWKMSGGYDDKKLRQILGEEKLGKGVGGELQEDDNAGDEDKINR